MRTNGSYFCYNLEADKTRFPINKRQALTYETIK